LGADEQEDIQGQRSTAVAGRAAAVTPCARERERESARSRATGKRERKEKSYCEARIDREE
jgi:hypothetical protein